MRAQPVWKISLGLWFPIAPMKIMPVYSGGVEYDRVAPYVLSARGVFIKKPITFTVLGFWIVATLNKALS